MAQITIIHLPPTLDGTSKVVLNERLDAIKQISLPLGFRIAIIDAFELLNKIPGDESIANGLGKSCAVWWCGRITFIEEAKNLWNVLHSHLSSLSLDIPVYDIPEDVEETFNLSLNYPILSKLGIPQAKTKLFPLTCEEISLPEKDLHNLLDKRLYLLPFPQKGIFFRTFYGTKKSGYFLNMASSHKELVERAIDLISFLRQYQNIGGIALREILSIEVYWDKAKDYYFQREVRVFIAWEKPVMWTYNVADLYQVWRKITPERLKDLKPSQEQFQQLEKICQILGKTFHARLLVADFAILKDGSLVLIEINPGHCSGWCHPAAYVGIYGNFLRQMVGLSQLNQTQIIDFCRQLGIGIWGLDLVFGFFPFGKYTKTGLPLLQSR